MRNGGGLQVVRVRPSAEALLAHLYPAQHVGWGLTISMECFLAWHGQGISTIGYESGTSVVLGGYHDHANTSSIMVCSRTKQVYWLLGRVPSSLTGLGLSGSIASPVEEEALGRCCNSIVATVHGAFGGASETTRGARGLVSGALRWK